jgi:hypothetical protein
MESGPGYVASSRARVFTTLSVVIQANVSYDGDKRIFNGIDFFASAEGTTNAALTPDKKMAFTATEVKFNGVDMQPSPEYEGPVIKPQVGSRSFEYSWSAKRVTFDFGKSYDRKISMKGQYNFGGQPLTNSLGPGVVPNSTNVSVSIPYSNK